MKRYMLLLSTLMLGAVAPNAAQAIVLQEEARTYALPALSQNQQQEVVLSWTEKDEQGMVYYYCALSKDEGKTFGEKKLIYASPGIGTGRLARPRLLFKKDGTMVATFSFNPTAKLQQDAAPAAGKHGGRPKDLYVYVTMSADGGNSWSTPQSVHQDQDPGVIRGFYDATLMANDELAVVYLKDIPNQPHQRDLRLVTSVNGVFQAERVIDPFVCDCCNLGLLTDEQGHLNVYYRENEDNIRDISRMVSTDNGQTWSASRTLYPDQWNVNACPHTGPSALRYGTTNLITYYSGVAGKPGVRLVDQTGKLLLVMNDETIRTASLAGDAKKAVILYGQGDAEHGLKVGYRTITKSKVAKEQWIDHSESGANPSGLVLGNNLLVVYELTNKGKVIGIKTDQVSLK